MKITSLQFAPWYRVCRRQRKVAKSPLVVLVALLAVATLVSVQTGISERIHKKGMLSDATTFMKKRALTQTNDDSSFVYKDVTRSNERVLYMAFYFPQYHIAPENKLAIKDGLEHYTDWDVLRANNRSLTPLVYYNLAADSEVFDRQDETADKYGVGVFIFYHYWRENSLLLNLPVDHFIRKKRKTKFIFCWDNMSGFLGKQKYDSPEKHAYQLLRYFMNENYLTDVYGRKPFIVYFTPGMDASYLRRLVIFLELHNVVVKVGHNYQKGRNFWDLPEWSQIASEFAPHFEGGPTRSNLYKYLPRDPTPWEVGKEYWQGAITSWDSRPRCNSVRTDQKRCGGHLKVPNGQVSVVEFGRQIQTIVANIHPKNKDRVVTLFAWNEWAEGAALEESVELGLGFLEQLI